MKPVRAIFKHVIYNEWRVRCACPAIIISLKTLLRDWIFGRFCGFRQNRLKIDPVWHRLKSRGCIVILMNSVKHKGEHKFIKISLYKERFQQTYIKVECASTTSAASGNKH